MKIDLNRPLKPRDNPTVVIPLHELRALEALAADRKKLLRRENTIRFSKGKPCFFCDRYPLLNAKVGSDYEKVYIDYHDDDCEWDEELGDA